MEDGTQQSGPGGIISVRGPQPEGVIVDGPHKNSVTFPTNTEQRSEHLQRFERLTARSQWRLSPPELFSLLMGVLKFQFDILDRHATGQVQIEFDIEDPFGGIGLVQRQA
ncbi:hypothetical protein FPOAC2_00699 [Fusarium poae]|uniref:Uncharacterized protein n=1 Tax=Fusarium poae TaxID=36050 RepID=A0A1B8B1T5_FUSPO|nr:hypothetical protein FPOAC1_000638 [Fusarium poae]KAG8674667.1 hypothetical protein FPOAC1_000638 [Fusarium poae]OBS26677.1 hypothetical protein FPOA_00619 [Fusarium poae]